MTDPDTQDPLARLSSKIADYITIVQDRRIPERVRLHDLRHMVFWQEYYARVTGALIAGDKPPVLRGTYKVINKGAQQANAEAREESLLRRLSAAHADLVRQFPQLPPATSIPYKQGSRTYARNDYIDTVRDHYSMHVHYLEKIAKGAPESFYVFHD